MPSLKVHISAALISLSILFAVLITRTLLVSSKQVENIPNFRTPELLPNDKYYEHLSKLIQFKTISYEDHNLIEIEPIDNLYKFIKETYPNFWNRMERIPVGNFSMIFKIEASADENKHKLPVLLMAHLDVVPPGSVPWDFEPFSGHISDTHVCGRGAIDDKQSLLGIVEALDLHIKNNLPVYRTIYVSFGFDEEIGGHKGACAVSQWFREQKIFFEFIHDEGMPLNIGMVPGVKAPVATIALAEKGYMDLKLVLRGPGGHSSMPEPNTLIGKMSKIVSLLENNPMPAQLDGIPRAMLENLASEMSFPQRFLFSNLWLFKPAVIFAMRMMPSTNAVIGTTTAVTIINGGNKLNVLPSEVTLHVNFRIAVHDTVISLLAHVKSLAHSVDPTVELIVMDSLEPAPYVDPHTKIFEVFEQATRAVYPDAVATPSVMIGNTDTRHFWNLTNNIYRYAPNLLTKEDIATFHGVNERISKQNIVNVIKFYYTLIQNLDKI